MDSWHTLEAHAQAPEYLSLTRWYMLEPHSLDIRELGIESRNLMQCTHSTLLTHISLINIGWLAGEGFTECPIPLDSARHACNCQGGRTMRYLADREPGRHTDWGRGVAPDPLAVVPLEGMAACQLLGEPAPSKYEPSKPHSWVCAYMRLIEHINLL